MSDGNKKTSKKGDGARAEIPVACIKRIAASVAGELRISTEATEILIEEAADNVRGIIERAMTYTVARKRKTISGEDVQAGLAMPN